MAVHRKLDQRRDDLCEKPTKRKPNRCTSYEVRDAIRRTASSQSLSAALREKDRPADSQSPGPQESSEADYVIVASNTGFKLAVSQLQVDNPQLRKFAQSAPREVLGNQHRQSQQSRLELGCVSAVDSNGRTIFVADAHRGDAKRFIVRADEKLTAFVELESAIGGG